MRFNLANKAERAWIRATWIDSMDLPDDELEGTFHWGQGRIIDGIFSSPTTAVILAKDVLRGEEAFIVAEQGLSPLTLVLHYVWVRQDLRRQGLASKMVELVGRSFSLDNTPIPVITTHSTLLGRAFAFHLNAVHNPYLAFERISKRKP